MKKLLKRFIKLSWKGIPIGIIATILVGTVAVLAATWIYSNTVTVTVLEEPVEPVYTLTLTAPTTVYINEPIGFTGSLMDVAHSTPVVGATIEVCDISGAPTFLFVVSTTITDASGAFTCEWTPAVLGNYQFQARYSAP